LPKMSERKIGMKKTKIICSIGPSSAKYKTLKQMVLYGMNCARINFSHATLEERETAVSLVKKVNEELGTNVGILYDTKGPDFRTGRVKNDEIVLETGKQIKLVKTQVVGTSERISVNFPEALNKIEIGHEILLEDGLMKLKAVSKDKDGILCDILAGGILGNKKGINVPDADLDLQFISESDYKDIIYACEHDGDFLALSFVNDKEDVLAVKNILSKYDSNMQIISKIESKASIKNIDEIIRVSDGIMIARGDLGVEVPMTEVPILQKQIIEKCRKKGRTCIVATEMFASMYKSARPTRAEISDVANAVLDGTDAVMLSGETTTGKHPDLAVMYMKEACKEAEKYYDYANQKSYAKENNIPSAIAHSVTETANLLDVKTIIASTKSGYTAKLISTLKPKSPILATCMSNEVARSLALNYGVYPTVVGRCHSYEEIIEMGKEKATAFQELKHGDLVIITGGFPRLNKEKTTDFMKIDKII